MNKKYFAYIRVSTVKQGERGSSLTEQKSAIEAYAARAPSPGDRATLAAMYPKIVATVAEPALAENIAQFQALASVEDQQMALVADEANASKLIEALDKTTIRGESAQLTIADEMPTIKRAAAAKKALSQLSTAVNDLLLLSAHSSKGSGDKHSLGH